MELEDFDVVEEVDIEDDDADMEDMEDDDAQDDEDIGTEDELSEDEVMDEIFKDPLESNLELDEECKKSCCGYLIESEADSKSVTVGILNAYSKTERIPENVDCVISEISQLYKTMYLMKEDLELHDKAAVLDCFLRYRHELLSKKMMGVLGIDTSRTDVQFCNIFPISSKRTPDFICEISKGSYIIIEVSAVSDIEKGARAKGDPRKGYESKYEKEILEVRALGFSVEYAVVIFDMKNEYNRDHIESINMVSNKLGKVIDIGLLHGLEYIKKELCTATKYINDGFGPCYKYLFSEPYTIANKCDFENLYIYGDPVESYKEDYIRYPVSSFMYDLSARLMLRLPIMIERAESNVKMSSRKLLVVYQQNQDRFHFVESEEGDYLDNWFESYKRGLRLWTCKNMRIMEGKNFVKQKADFEYFDLSPKDLETGYRRNFSNLPPILVHDGSTKFKNETVYKDFRNIVKSQEYAKMLSKYEDGSYEEKILEKMSQFNERHPLGQKLNFSPAPFSDSVVDSDMFNNALKGFSEHMDEMNSMTDTMGKVHIKQPFLYPIYKPCLDGYCSLETKPVDFINSLLQTSELGKYTRLILNFALSDNFKFGTHKDVKENKLLEARKELSEYNRSLNAMLKEKSRCLGPKKAAKIEDLEDQKNIRETLSSLNKRVREESTKAGVISGKIGIMSLNKSKKNKIYFSEEMAHFKRKKTPAFYKGIGNNYNKELVEQHVGEFLSVLVAPSLLSTNWDILDNNVYRDSQLLKDLKEKALEEVSGFYGHLKGTNLYGVCEFISKFCHSLLYHSQTSSNSSQIALDNLGYKNTILIVKGGKKIFGTKKTKLFRLFHPVFDSVRNLYEHRGHKGSFSFTNINNCTYIMTPWMNLHETVVTDGLTLSHRLMGFSVLNYKDNLCFESNIRRLIFNIILSLHNRRQTETLMHNLRYVFMNCMSYFSSVDQILPELAGYNYDLIQVWIREKLKDNFIPFATKMNEIHSQTTKGNIKQLMKKKDLRHPFTEEPINDLETLSLAVYSTYLMSKAPTTQSLEQVGNLKQMLDTHNEFTENFKSTEETVVTLNESNLDDYYKRVFNSDFNYDPKYCVLLGKFFGDYLNSMSLEKTLHLKWEQILDECWNSLANTKGLRYKGKEFFGSKGYYVVSKCVLEDEGGNSRLIDLFNLVSSNKSENEKMKEIKTFNSTYRDRIAKKPFERAIFHVVDKKQRGGKREIFVMDMETKVHQQVIEKYMAYICKLTPNEMISIPSNRRLQTVHSRVFESGNSSEDQCYLVLDCRKWAPRSLIEKFLLFLSGMNNVLPTSFTYHCQNFFYMLMNKKIYTRKYIVDQLNSNDNNKKYGLMLVEDKDNGGFFYTPEYSWVMGIFNYFSSLFHVACQMHISHLLRKNFSESFDVECNLHMIAHSDDSAGKINCGGKDLVSRSLFFYELFMHSANHLISKKKSNVGKVYYEFISILYIGGELLSLLAKFAGMFNFHPSDNGYCTDITESYSKCIELVLNGASLNQAYIAQKIQADLIYKFYFNRPPESASYLIPPSMFGSVDAHPLMVMLCGSDADSVRIMHNITDEELNILISINEALLPVNSTGEGIFKQFNCHPNVRLNDKLKELKENNPIPDSLSESWSLKNVKYKNTMLDTIQFLMKLGDKKFVAALQDETVVRRISRSYYYRSGLTIETKQGPMSMKSLKELIFLLRLSPDEESIKLLPADHRNAIEEAGKFMKETGAKVGDLLRNLFEFVHNEAMVFLKHLDKFRLKSENIIKSKKTCKPVHFKVQSLIEECPIDFEPTSLVSWIKEPQYRFLLPNTKGLMTAQRFLEKVMYKFDVDIEDVTPETLFSLAMKIHKRSRIEFFCYSNLPAGTREISTYQDLMIYIAHNSNSDEYIKGLDVQFGKVVSTSSWIMLPDFDSDEIQWTMSFLLVVLTSLKSNRNNIFEILRLEVNAPKFILDSEPGIVKMDLLQMYSKVRKIWSGKYKYDRYLMPYMHQIEKLIDGDDFLDPELISDTFYHSFIKNQFLLNNLWLGRGKLFISCGIFKLVVNVSNTQIVSITTRTLDHYFSNDEMSYINFCLFNSQLPSLNESMRPIGVDDWPNYMLGIDRDSNYYIGRARDMISGISVDFDVNLGTPLSQMDLGVLRYDRKGKMVWEKEDDGVRHKHTINFVPLSPQNAMDWMKSLFIDSSFNNRQLTKINSSSDKFLIDMCVEDFDLEVNVNIQSIVVSPTSSMLYKILKFCDSLQLCKTKPEGVIYTHYPAKDGGLLKALIEYSKTNNDFGFNWEHKLTPEYYGLKSSQPESFTTELFDNIRSNYESLFSRIDKESIARALGNILGGDMNDENKVMKVACEWGFVGVQGAIDSMMGERKRSNFTGVREYNNGPLMAYYSTIFLEYQAMIFRLLSELMMESPGGFSLSAMPWVRVDGSNYKQHFISSVHQIVIGNYRRAPRRGSTMRLTEAFIYEVLKQSFRFKRVRGFFEQEVSKIANFRTFPCEEKDFDNWMIVWNTLLKNYENKNGNKVEVDYCAVVDRNEGYERPYIITKSICAAIGLNFNLKRTYHSGAISSTIYNRYNENYKLNFDGKNYSFKLRVGNIINNERVVFSDHIFPRHPFSKGFLTSDEFDDVQTELSSSEFDEESYNDAIENYEGRVYDFKPLKRVKHVSQGKLQDTILVEVPVVLLMGGSFNFTNLDRLRQVSEDIVVLSDQLDIKMINVSNPPMAFKNLENRWFNLSLIAPQGLFTYIFTNRLRFEGLWERLLCLSPITKEDISRLLVRSMGGYTKSTGLVSNNFMLTDNELVDTYYQGVRNLIEEEEKIKKEKEDERIKSDQDSLCSEASKSNSLEEDYEIIKEKIEKSMYESGMDVEQVSKYSRMIEKEWLSKESNRTDKKVGISIIDYFRNFFSKGDGKLEELKSKFGEVLKKDLTKEQSELMFQVPLIFGGGRSRKRSKVNKTLRNPYFISEMESLSPGLIWDLISGNLGISELSRKRWDNQLVLLGMMSKGLKSNKKGKLFLLNLIKLILNDARPSMPDDKDDDRWSDLIHKTTEIYIKGEDSSSDDEFAFDEPFGGSRLNYEVAGMSNLT